jgi:membrane-associated phospholipid phosphatase
MRNALNQSCALSSIHWLHYKSSSFAVAALLACPLTVALAHAQGDAPPVTLAASASEALPSPPAADPNLSEPNPSLPEANPAMPAADPSVPRTNTSGPGATRDPDISWKHFPMRVLEDQKNLWLFPTQLARGKHWVPTLAITGVTGVLIATDPHTQPHFRNNAAFDGTSEIFSTSNTAIVEFGVPAVIYVTGLVRHDSYTQQTAILAGEAYVDTTSPQVVIQLVSRRLRPSQVAPEHDFRDTFFRTRAVDVFSKGTSFPSGHATAAFAVATVMARRYGQQARSRNKGSGGGIGFPIAR